MTDQLALGYACCLIASVAYAVNFLPVKKYETGDGIFFTFAMSLGILMVGLVMGFMQHEPFVFEPLAAVGGVIFTMGNLVCPLVIQLIGLGLGLTIWDLSNMLMGWFTGRFGLFGVDQEISEKPLFNYIGLALACVSLVFMYLAAHFDTKPKEVESQNLEGAEDLERTTSVGPEGREAKPHENGHGYIFGHARRRSLWRDLRPAPGSDAGAVWREPQQLCSGLRLQPLSWDLCLGSCVLARLRPRAAEKKLCPLEPRAAGHVLRHHLGHWHGCLVPGQRGAGLLSDVSNH
ncbi:unnamed protein product [Effrenium voratum]|uniref:Uncharacterized protein n=1 Tax=Effrenium voratum TaxID=2562239 RepID=A0AA36JEE5_9DINO|nr:unnamed protein product [Effrenium voratum]